MRELKAILAIFVFLLATLPAFPDTGCDMSNGCPPSGGGGFSIGNVLTGGFNAGAGATYTTGSITLTPGQAFIMFINACNGATCGGGSGTSFTVVGSLGDTLTCPAGAFGNLSATGLYGQVCAIGSSVGGSETFLVTFVGSALPYYLGANGAAVNGVVASSFIDTGTENTNANSGSTNPTVTSGAVSQSGEFCFAGVNAGTALTAGLTNINQYNSNTIGLQWTTGPASGTQVMPWTASSGNWVASGMCLKHP